MSDGLDALTLATDAQRLATTPGHSAWVEANAGTGKTKVLTDRVTRLLLDRVKPERILCLTFTKAAAAEMRNRLAGQLGRWAMAEQARLDEAIEQLIDRAPDPAERVVARRIFGNRDDPYAVHRTGGERLVDTVDGVVIGQRKQLHSCAGGVLDHLGGRQLAIGVERMRL